MDPRGEFPLNDDWAFSRPVKTLCDENRLEMSEWPVMSLIAHIGWGWLVSSICGFSFTALRISVALIGLAGVLVTRKMIHEITGDGEASTLGALAVGFNAIYFSLSFTFMTDVPFFFWQTLAMYFYLRALRGDGLGWLALGTLAAAAAVLIRQVGLLLPVGFALAVLVRERFGLRAWVRGAGAVIFIYGALAAYERWMEVTVGLPAVYRTYEADVWQKISAGLVPLITNTSEMLMICMVYLGLFMFPALLVWLPRKSRADKIVSGLSALAGLGLALWLHHQERLMPLLPKGIFTDFALGPTLLRDVFHLQRDNLYKAPEFLLFLLTLLGCVGAFWLLRYATIAARGALAWVFRGRGDRFRAAAVVFGFGSALIILLPLAIKFPFDRYLLSCVPGLIVGAAAVAALSGLPALCWQRWGAAAFIMGSAIFAVAGTHDYLAWNRARWNAAHWLCVEHGIPHSRVDGGFEFGGWHLFDPSYSGDNRRSWWWVGDDEFTITFGMIEDHRVMKNFPYTRWCPPRQDFITVLELRDKRADRLHLAATVRQAGRNVKTRDGRIVRYWDAKSHKLPVLVAFGCDMRIAPGHYLARFRLAAGQPENKEEKNTGLLRVVEFPNGRPLAESFVSVRGRGPHEYLCQDLPFEVGADRRIEVQVGGGKVQLWLDSVEFIPVEKP